METHRKEKKRKTIAATITIKTMNEHTTVTLGISLPHLQRQQNRKISMLKLLMPTPLPQLLLITLSTPQEEGFLDSKRTQFYTATVGWPSDAAAHTMSFRAGRSSLLQKLRYSIVSPRSFRTSTTSTEGATANISAATASFPFLPLLSSPSSLTPAAELLVTLIRPSALAATPSSLDMTRLAGSFVANRMPCSRFGPSSNRGERSKPCDSEMRWNAFSFSGSSPSEGFFVSVGGGGGGLSTEEVFLNHGESMIFATETRVLAFGSRSLVIRRRASEENHGGHLKSPLYIFRYIATRLSSCVQIKGK